MTENVILIFFASALNPDLQLNDVTKTTCSVCFRLLVVSRRVGFIVDGVISVSADTKSNFNCLQMFPKSTHISRLSSCGKHSHHAQTKAHGLDLIRSAVR